MTIVFLAVMTSGIAFIKLFGLGLTLAVLMDAFVVRGMLVPAFMRLAGPANWWAPAFLRRPLGPSVQAPLPMAEEVEPVGAERVAHRLAASASPERRSTAAPVRAKSSVS